MCLRFFRIRLFCSLEISSGFVFSFIFSGIYLFNRSYRLHNLICLSVLISNGSFRYADLVLWCVDWGPSTQRKCCCTSLLLCYSLFQLLLLIRTTISFQKTFCLCVLLQSFQLLSLVLVFVPSVLFREARIRIFPPVMFSYHLDTDFSVKVKV